MSDGFRLLHKHSEQGYTERPAQALTGEPEAIPAQAQERQASEANARDHERAKRVWGEHLSVILIVLRQYEEHPMSAPARGEIVGVRKQLDRVRRRL